MFKERDGGWKVCFFSTATGGWEGSESFFGERGDSMRHFFSFLFFEWSGVEKGELKWR